jgi:hypothetical protein
MSVFTHASRCKRVCKAAEGAEIKVTCCARMHMTADSVHGVLDKKRSCHIRWELTLFRYLGTRLDINSYVIAKHKGRCSYLHTRVARDKHRVGPALPLSFATCWKC